MKVNATELDFLVMLSNAGGLHRFEPTDNVTREAHRMLRSLDRRGYISVEAENGITTVTLSPMGMEEVENANSA